MYRQCRADVGLFIKYNTLLPNSDAMKRLFFMGPAILTAKRTSLTLRASFSEERLRFLKWQGVAQDDVDNMPSMSRKNRLQAYQHFQS